MSAGRKRPNPSRDEGLEGEEEMPASSRDHSAAPVHNVVPSDPAPTTSSSSRGKHKQGQYDPRWEMKYDWVYPSDDGKGMFCKLCKRFNTHNERNTSAIFNLSPCVSLRKDVLARHADSNMHKQAVRQEHERLAAEASDGIEQAFHEAASVHGMPALYQNKHA